MIMPRGQELLYSARISLDRTQLAVGHPCQLLQSCTPCCRRRERHDALEYQHQGKPQQQCLVHLPLRGFFMYLKKSALGSTTSTSLFLAKLCL